MVIVVAASAHISCTALPNATYAYNPATDTATMKLGTNSAWEEFLVKINLLVDSQIPLPPPQRTRQGTTASFRMKELCGNTGCITLCSLASQFVTY